MIKESFTHHPIHRLLQTRWSPRSFSGQPVDRATMLSLFDAARWAPSSSNLQPWAFVVTERNGSEEFDGFVELLNPGNAKWAKNAPLLVLAVAKMDRKPGQPNFYALYDLGQAVAHFSVQASALGLYVHQMGGFDREKAREYFNIPEGYEPVTAIAVGYQGSAEDLPEDLRARELEPRSRKPLAEMVFDGNWNHPLEQSPELPEVEAA